MSTVFLMLFDGQGTGQSDGRTDGKIVCLLPWSNTIPYSGHISLYFIPYSDIQDIYTKYLRRSDCKITQATCELS